MRLNALLVDDEMPILQNLQAVLPWDELDIGIAGLARNGREALEKAKTLKPDLILCDIRMPVMDGIAFLSELRTFDGECEVIMLTGYAEFEYARSAIRHRVREYVLKPINYEDLAELLERTAASIRARRSARRDAAKRLGRVTDLAHEKVVQDLLLGVADPADANARLSWAEGEAAPAAASCAVMLADADVGAQRGEGAADPERERKLWNFAVRNVLEEALPRPDGVRAVVLQMRDGEWCVVAGGDAGRMTDAAIAEWAAALHRTVLDLLRIRLALCYCPKPVAAEDLSAVYQKLRRAVQTAPEGERGPWPLEEGGEPDAHRAPVWEPLDGLAAAIKRGDRAEAGRMLDLLASRLQAAAASSLAGAQKMAHFCVVHLLREMRDLQVLSPETEKRAWERFAQSDRLNDAVALMRHLTDASLAAQAGKKTADRLMEAAKDYVDRHLSRDLCVDEVADHLGISASYFSMLFKRKYGVTFLEYVTAERIEMAKTMLLLTDRSVTEISRAVGFAERRYFTKVFQKRTGERPSAFREKRKNQA